MHPTGSYSQGCAPGSSDCFMWRFHLRTAYCMGEAKIQEASFSVAGPFCMVGRRRLAME